MERRDVNAADFDWNMLLRHVVGNQATVEVAQNDVAVARIEPIKQRVSMSDIAAVLADVPTLGDDVDCFAADIEQALKVLPEKDDPWES
jgi:hypothetical protein